MSRLPVLNPLSTVRESKVIANQETIANQTQIVTPSNTRFKRTVFHTPAIIQTVVDTPETVLPPPPPPQIRLTPEYIPRVPMTRVDSTVNSSYVMPRPSIPVMRPNTEVRTVIRQDHFDRGIGVKVHEDLSTFRPSVHPVVHEEVKNHGFCHRLLGYCWGHKCPFWVFILIPVLLILLLLALSYFINRHRIFYGFDTSTMNAGAGSSGIANEHVLNSAMNRHPDIVNPIVSTDQNMMTPTTTTTTQIQNRETISNPNINTHPNFNTDPSLMNPSLNPHGNMGMNSMAGTPLTGADIYSRVLAQQHHPPTSTQTQIVRNETTISDDGLMNQTPGLEASAMSNIARTVDTQTIDGIRLAPTIEEVKTRMMIDAEREGVKVHQTLKSHKKKSHLRYYVQ